MVHLAEVLAGPARAVAVEDRWEFPLEALGVRAVRAALEVQEVRVAQVRHLVARPQAAVVQEVRLAVRRFLGYRLVDYLVQVSDSIKLLSPKGQDQSLTSAP